MAIFQQLRNLIRTPVTQDGMELNRYGTIRVHDCGVHEASSVADWGEIRERDWLVGEISFAPTRGGFRFPSNTQTRRTTLRDTGQQ